MQGRLLDEEERDRCDLVSGAVHLPDFVDEDDQRTLLRICAYAMQAAGHIRHATGVIASSFGYWIERTGYQEPRLPMDELLLRLSRKAVIKTMPQFVEFEPDSATILAFPPGYPEDGWTPLRPSIQESDEAIAAGWPVVTIGLAASCDFRFYHYNSQCDRTIELRSGDVFIYGGSVRRALRQIVGVRADSSPLATKTGCGITITMRRVKP